MNNEMSFEEALKRLEEINEKLESEDISIEEAVTVYKEGIEISRFCQQKLDEAKLEIEKVNNI